MPELPEVEVIRSHLRNQILEAKIESIQFGRDDIVRAGRSMSNWFPGTTITDITRRGKCLLFTCHRSGETRYMASELGMTGLWFYEPTLATSPQHLHVHLALSGTHAHHLYYWNPRRFGRIWLLDQHGMEEFCRRRFGPEALELNEGDFTALMKNCRGRLKSLLLNQHRIAGIGNIYANEILFHAGVHPYAHGNRLRTTTCRRLFQALHQILEEAIGAGGSSIRDFRAPDGTMGRFQQVHRVYRKEYQTCSRGCLTTIRRLRGDRSSFFCPSCQKKH